MSSEHDEDDTLSKAATVDSKAAKATVDSEAADDGGGGGGGGGEATKLVDIISEFRADLFVTFPELKEMFVATDEETEAYCKELYPKLFFEILYENTTLFDEHPHLLPEVDFKVLMTDEGVSEKTKKTIWKYLQLIVFAVLETMEDASQFGDTSHLFEAIRDEDLHRKISESMEEMKQFFDASSNFMDPSFSPFGAADEDNGGVDASSASSERFNPEDLKSHLDGLMKGKIGSLAKEIATEAQSEIGGEMNDPNYIQNLMKNPKKVLDLVKNIGAKVENKIKQGELKESELLEEATDIMKQIKNIPGLKSVFSKMGMNPNDMDFKGMANKMNETMRTAKTKERMNRKREERQAAAAAAAAAEVTKPAIPSDVTLVEESDDTIVFRIEGNTKTKTTNQAQKKKKGKKSKN